MKSSRRQFLKWGASSMAALAAAPLMPFSARAAGVSGVADKLLFVIGATGGATMADSFMCVKESEVSSPELADELIVYPDAYVKTYPGNLRALDLPASYRTYLGSAIGLPYAMSTFVSKYHPYMAAMAVENTSVNHLVAQERAMTGQGVSPSLSLEPEDGKLFLGHVVERSQVC